MRLKKYTQSKYKHSFVEALQKWDDDADDDEKYGESTEEKKKTEKRTYKAHMKKSTDSQIEWMIRCFIIIHNANILKRENRATAHKHIKHTHTVFWNKNSNKIAFNERRNDNIIQHIYIE